MGAPRWRRRSSARASRPSAGRETAAAARNRLLGCGPPRPDRKMVACVLMLLTPLRRREFVLLGVLVVAGCGGKSSDGKGGTGGAGGRGGAAGRGGGSGTGGVGAA